MLIIRSHYGSNVTASAGYIWVQGGSAAGGNSNRLTTSAGMPGNMQYNSSRRGTQIYANGIAFADPYNGNSNSDAGWIRHIEESTNSGYLEIAVGDDASGENIYLRQYNTSNGIAKSINVFSDLITTSNISSQSVNYATSAGSASSATSSKTLLTNNTAQKPDACYDANPGLHFYRYSGGGVGDTDGFILQWSWNQGSVGGQLYLDDNPNNYIAIRGCTGSSGTSPTGFTSWYRIYGDNYHPSADYATSAGSVAWSDVTNKPSSFTPASHSHDYLPTSGGTVSGVITIAKNDNYGLAASANYSQIGFVDRYFWKGHINNMYSNSISSLDESGAPGFPKGLTSAGDISSSGNYYVISDRRLKKNISNILESSLDVLFNISDKLIKKFTWKTTGKESYGFIAQLLEQYIPEAVSNMINGTKTVSYDIAYAKIIAALIHKVKAQEKQISLLLEHANFSQEL